MDLDDVHRELAARLRALAPGEFLTVGEPVGAPVRRLLRRSRPPASRYVQFLRDPHHLYGECVGATAFGGDWEIDEAEHQRIRALGWLAPGDPDPAGTRPAYPHYWVTLDADRADELAAMGVGALEVLGVDPATLEWRS